jgi:hypothetical protein
LLDGAPVTVGVLGNPLGMDTVTITPLVKRLQLANSRARETIPAEVTQFGARATTSEDAIADADVLPLHAAQQHRRDRAAAIEFAR